MSRVVALERFGHRRAHDHMISKRVIEVLGGASLVARSLVQNYVEAADASEDIDRLYESKCIRGLH